MDRVFWIGVAIIIVALITGALVGYFSPLERCIREQTELSRTIDGVARSMCTSKLATNSG